jgi:hypothetical protein
MREQSAIMTDGAFQRECETWLDRLRSRSRQADRTAERRVRLGSNQVWSTEPRSRLVIECRSGSAWITQTGDRRDHIVDAGRHLVLGANGKVVVNGLAPDTELVVHET